MVELLSDHHVLPLGEEYKTALGREAAEVAFLLNIDVGPPDFFESAQTVLLV